MDSYAWKLNEGLTFVSENVFENFFDNNSFNLGQLCAPVKKVGFLRETFEEAKMDKIKPNLITFQRSL